MDSFPSLFQRLESIAADRCDGTEPAHDFLHVKRVVANARVLAESARAHVPIATCAALLHELFNYPKGHPDSKRSGEVCAQEARKVLLREEAPTEWIDGVCYAIAVHPFSLGVMPETLEAKILQDADRLDAIGAVGIARCFATCADLKRPLYSPEDPFCQNRPPADKQWGVDHFYAKLLRLQDTMHTPKARVLAQSRIDFMKAYLQQLANELG